MQRDGTAAKAVLLRILTCKRLLKAKEPHQVSFIWVKGHAGHPQNERCDQLATSAADGDDLMIDEGLES